MFLSSHVDGSAHYSNQIYGNNYDFSSRHNSAGPLQPLETPHLFLRVPRVKSEYEALARRFIEALRSRLPLGRIEHVIVRDERSNPGSYARPDFSCVLLTSDSKARFNSALFYPGQRFWLKRAGGPLVATGSLSRWIETSRENWSDADIRALCVGHRIFKHEPTWRELAENQDKFFLLLFFNDVMDLEVPLFPRARANGRNIVVLENNALQLAWLYADDCDLNFPPEDTGTPVHRHRHHSHRFQWERLLSIEVSNALDDRMPRNGKFQDRVAIVNDALAAYFRILDGRRKEVLNDFSEDDLTIIAEVAEELSHDSYENRSELQHFLRMRGEASAVSGEAVGAQLIEIAEHLAELTSDDFEIVFDEAQRLTACMSSLERRKSTGRWRTIVREHHVERRFEEEFGHETNSELILGDEERSDRG